MYDPSVTRARWEIEDKQGWREDMHIIPFIQFPADWKVQVIPPFADACIRFRVKLPDDREKSIYLDTRNSLGYMEYPYWEVYPVGDDCGRCEMVDVDKLLELIGAE